MNRYHLSTPSQLDTLALFFHSLKAKESDKLVPIIFRPFHEHNGDWFWWCKAHTTEEDFITL
jgi:mannan endo-1,4-beta-mannosidase